jgi:O-antigen/teichoic acid export membrane protein
MTPSVLHNFLLAILSIAGSKVFRFLYISWIIRTAGVEVWGAVAFAIVVVFYATHLLDFGRSLLATIHATDDEEWDKHYLHSLLWKRLALSAPIVAGGWWILGELSIEGGEALRWYLLLLLIRPFYPDWLYQRKHLNGLLQLFQGIRQLLLLVLIVSLEYKSPVEIIRLELLSEVLLVVIMWWRLPGMKHLEKPETSKEKEIWKNSWPLFISMWFMVLHQNGDILVIRWFADLSELGVYDFSYKIMLFAFGGGIALSGSLRPRFSSLQKKSIQLLWGSRLLVAGQRVLMLVSLGFIAFVYFYASFVLEQFFPDNAAQVVPILKVIGWFVPLSFLVVPMSEWVIVHDERKVFMAIVVSAGVSNIVLNMIFVPLWGLIGAAWATILVESLFLLFYLWRSARFFQWSLNRRVFLIPLSFAAMAYSSLWVSWYAGFFIYFLIIGVWSLSGLLSVEHFRWLKEKDFADAEG